VPHFLNLARKREVRAHVRFGAPVKGNSDRKELARALHSAVSILSKPEMDAEGHR